MNEPSSKSCSNWADITEAFDSFPHPRLGFDIDWELHETLWVFRGHKSAEYRLEPSIEREVATKPLSWPALEAKILEEFQSRAQMHLSPSDVPKPDDRLSWLALMQHYGIPTRLLDFTLSPYVALYFALSNRTAKEQSSQAEVWAIDAQALMKVAHLKFAEAKKEQAEFLERKSGVSLRIQGASLDPRTFSSERDVFEDKEKYRREMFSEALAPRPIFRSCFCKSGFAALAFPPIQNRRLSSQQGAFLLTGAEESALQDSLFRMMKGQETEWFKRFQITNDAMGDMERQLFRRNIHHLSLFPDMEGLAGFIRQKTRLHWVPDDNPFVYQP